MEVLLKTRLRNGPLPPVADDRISSLGQAVRSERQRRKMSQAAMGRELEADGQTISNLETGRTRTMSLNSLRLLQEKFGIDASKLATEESPIPLSMIPPLLLEQLRADAKGHSMSLPEYLRQARDAFHELHPKPQPKNAPSKQKGT